MWLKVRRFVKKRSLIFTLIGSSFLFRGVTAHAEEVTESFNNAINDAIYIGSGNQLRVEAPFVKLTKAEVVKIGLELKVPYKYTWSCYEGGDKPCGVCGTCIDRAEAFRLNGVKDPALEN